MTADFAPGPFDRRRPTVLQVLPALETGGVERGCIDVALALKEAGWRPLVASRGGRLVGELQRAEIPHIALPLHRKDPISHVLNRIALRKLIQAHTVDIVHARSRAPAWAAQVAAQVAGAAFVTTFHGTYNFRSDWKRTYNSVMADGVRVIAISDFIRRHILENYECPAERIRVIPRGIDIARFDPTLIPPGQVADLARRLRIDDGKPVVMLPGRLTRWKGQMVLIEAMARLGRRDVHCLLVGEDQGRTRYRHALEARVRELGLEGVVRLTGPINDMPTAYLLADVVISASTDPEAFGRVAAEAGAMGRPVVATSHGGSLEIVKDGLTGWLIRPDEPDQLAAGIAQALELDTPLRTHLALRAIEHVRAHFTKDAMCAATLNVYREVLAERRGDAGV